MPSIQGELTNESFPQVKLMLRIFDTRGFFSASTLFRLSTHLDIPYRQESEKYLPVEESPQPRAKSREQPRVFAREGASDFLRQTNRIGTILSFSYSANSEGKEPHSAGEKADHPSSKLACLYYQQILVFPNTRPSLTPREAYA